MRYKVGMCGGVFDPIHLGHKNLILTAANQCEELYVVLSVSKGNLIPYELRFRWLKRMVNDLDNVTVITSFDDSLDKDTYDWKVGCDDIRTKIGKPLDVVFVGDDYNYDGNPFATNYTEAEIVYVNRKDINISSTEIRNNPYKYWDLIAPEAREYFVKKVVVLGSESCGKSTLIRNLAKYYGTVCVEEKGRDICDFAGGIDTMIPSDFVEILYKHKVDEIEKTRIANKVLFIDTEAYVTDYYLKLQFMNTDVDFSKEDKLAKMIGSLNKYDLVIYLEPDVPWVQDGTRTYGDDEVREKNDRLLKCILKEADLKYIVINGDYEDRFRETVKLVDKILEKK